MRKILFISFLAVLIKGVFAQQEQQYSQYVINPFTINPAVSSTEDYMDVQLGHRSQWAGLEGAPKTTYLTGFKTIGKPFYHSHYKAEHSSWHGIGVQVYDDRTGPIQRNAMLLAYSYNMPLFKKTRLSLGTYVGAKQTSVNQSYWENIEDQSDRLFAEDLSTGLTPEVQLGAVLYSKTYFVTFSANNLLGQKMSFLDESTDFEGTYQRHYYLSGGIKWRAAKKIYLTPSAMIKYTDNSPVGVDLNLKAADRLSKIWGGVSMRLQESFGLFVGINLRSMFDVTYAFDLPYSKVRRSNFGTHELILGLRLKHPHVTVDPSKYW